MTKNFFIGLLVGVIISLALASGYFLLNREKLLSPSGVATLVPRPKPLLKYTYENLKGRTYSPSEIKFETILSSDSAHTVWQISYLSDGKKVSGTANLPKNVSLEGAWTKPVIIMIRGYADPKEYFPGFGTEHFAAVLAQNGFVTIAPDFLGYASSDGPSKDPYEDRFLTYTTVLNLISSVENNCKMQIAKCKFGIWAHSNGGQIALSALEISGKKIPTALWNPVSVTFPYSILYYTFDSDDHGKGLRKGLADFEADYDTEKYSPTNYFDWINAPILLQQGSADESVPQKWSDDLDKALGDRHKATDYKIYPGNDHNMAPNWNQAASDTLQFFGKEL